jgi:hypothetical protein
MNKGNNLAPSLPDKDFEGDMRIVDSVIDIGADEYSDIDNDGICDYEDNCPNNCNSQQLDADNDGIGDVCDTTPGCGGCAQPQCEQEC